MLSCMARAKKTGTRSRLLGFGPWGYFFSACFVATLFWAILSPDPQHEFLTLVHRLFGVRALLWTVVWPMNANYLALQYYSFNLIFAASLVVAIFISSRRITVLGYVAIFIIAILSVRAWYWGTNLYDAAAKSEVLLAYFEAWNPRNHSAAAGAVFANTLAAIALSLICRSFIVGLATFSISIVAIFEPHLFPGYAILIANPPWGAFGISSSLALTHGAYASVLLIWAWRVRMRVRVNTTGCVTCGYDIAGLPSPLCPECGTPIEDSAALRGPPR